MCTTQQLVSKISICFISLPSPWSSTGVGVSVGSTTSWVSGYRHVTGMVEIVTSYLVHSLHIFPTVVSPCSLVDVYGASVCGETETMCHVLR